MASEQTRPSQGPASAKHAAAVRGRGERGAVLVHVAIALVGLLAFSAFVIDYGVLWAARRQAQNSADAGAMAGAVSMGFVNMDDQALARASALSAATRNWIWGQPPDVTEADVTFPVCPPGSPGEGTNACIQVNVFRTTYQRPGGNPLPTLFGNLVGVTQQGVRATAMAEVLFGDSTDCVKPFAIPDKWLENRNDQPPAGWDPNDTFERYVQNGPNQGQLLDPADYYEAPGGPRYPPNGTGFTREGSQLGGSDYGLEIVLKNGTPQQAIAPGWYFAVVINPNEGPGADNYGENIAECDPTVIGPGTVLETEPGNMVGPTRQGIADLIAQDPYARWDTSANNGLGGITGGCMADPVSPCGLSPRLVAIPLFNPDLYDAGRGSGRIEITVTKVLGFFIVGLQGNDVVGRLMTYPTAARRGTSETPGASFLISIALVR